MQRRLNWRVLFWTLGCLLVGGVIVHWIHGFQVRRNVGTLLEHADRATEVGNLGQAVSYYAQYLAYEPEDTAALTKFGRALDQQAKSVDDWQRVVATIEKLLLNDPGRKELRFRLIINLIQLQRYREAIGHMQTLLPQWQDKAELEHILGWCQDAQGDSPRAAATLTRALAMDPRRVATYVLLAEILQNRLDHPEKADEVMDEMVHANAQSFGAYLARFNYRRANASRHAQQGETGAQAEADLQKALELGRAEPAVLLAASDWEVSRGDLGKAREWLHNAWRLEPGNVAVIKALAELESRAGRAAEAIAVLTAGVKDRPYAPELQVMLTDLFADEGKLRDAAELIDTSTNRLKLEEARKILDPLARRQKTWPRVPLLQARIEELEGNDDQAITYYLQAVDLGEKQPRHLTRLLHLLVHAKRTLDAEQILNKIEEQVALPAELIRLAADIAVANQNTGEALRRAAQAVSSIRDYRDYLWLGRIYHSTGEDTKAEEALRQGVALAPHTPDTWIALVQQLTHMGRRDAAWAVVTDARTKVAASLAAYTQARCLEGMGLVDLAENFYREALAQEGDDFVILASAADFFRHTDQPSKAGPFLEALVKLAGVAPAEYVVRARRQLALILAAQGYEGQQKALALIDENMQRQSNNPLDLRARAFIQAAKPGQRRQSIRVFEETARRQPLAGAEQLQLAQLFDADGDEARAREQIMSLLTTQPEKPQFLAFYIRQLLKGEEIDQARVHFQMLERLEPGSARTLELKAMVK